MMQWWQRCNAGKVVLSNSSLTVKNLDHLGTVAGFVDELGLVDCLNEQIGSDPRETVSIGVVVKAIILNGLGFVSIVNLTDERRHILQFFGTPCQQYDLLC